MESGHGPRRLMAGGDTVGTFTPPSGLWMLA